MFKLRLRTALKAAYMSLKLFDESENPSSIELLTKDTAKSEPDTRADIDRSEKTRLGYLLAILTTFVLSIICFAYGVHVLAINNAAEIATLPQLTLSLPASEIDRIYTTYNIPPYYVLVSVPKAAQEGLALVLNILITTLNDSMASAHAVSLRWALYSEDRLTFNSPIRLFTSSNHSLPNRWYTNVASLAFLILAYAASSVLMITTRSYEDYTHTNQVVISGTSLIALALAMSGQAAISLWCMVGIEHKIPTWSSNPLNTTLAAIRGNRISHIKGRCMMSVHERVDPTPSQGTYPLGRQQNIYRAHDAVKRILAFLWILALSSVAWVVTILAISRSLGNDDDGGGPHCWSIGFDWDFDEGRCGRNSVPLAMTPSRNVQRSGASTPSYSFAVQTVLAVLFACLTQGSYTIALHFVELFVNMTREEALWRRAYSVTQPCRDAGLSSLGASLKTNPVLSAIQSWEYIALFLLKSCLHWALGQALFANILYGYDTDGQYRFGIQFNMTYPRLIIFAILVIMLAGFSTFLVFRQQKGPQPAAMGHIQTIANLIDNWEVDGKGQLWWGDITSGPPVYNDAGEIVRHAGTSNKKEELQSIRLRSVYAG